MITTWRSASLFTTLAVVLFSAMVTVTVLWQGTDGDGWKQTIRSDAKGYYGYLVSMFIRKDLGNEPMAWEYVQRTPTGTLNKYFSGTSLMMAPWFLIGHDLALGDPKVEHDGLSVYEQKAIGVGGWVYLLLGLLAMRALLLGLGVREGVVAWIIVTLGLGTTLIQYAAVQAGWSHIYSFCTISVFLLLVHRVSRGARLRWLVVAAAVLGLIVLIRPVNALIVLAIPIVLGRDTLPLFRRILERPGVVILALLAGAAVVFIQPLLWYLQTGNWFEWGYRKEGFHWDRPEVMNVLFSFRRGLFVWTPVMLLPVLCMVLLWRHDRVRSMASIIYFTLNLYVISAWWIWYYGSGFGSRVFIDHYPVLVIPMALVMHHWNTRWWTVARTVFCLCIALNLAQFVQYHRNILHHESMDREKYLYTFLRFGEEYRGQLGGNDQVPPFDPKGMTAVLMESTDLERPAKYWKGGRVERLDKAFSGRHVAVYDAQNEFGPTFEAAAGTLPTGRELFLEVGFQCYEAKARDSFHAIGVTAIHTGDSITFYRSFRMNDLPGQLDDHWRRCSYRIPMPALQEGETMRFYLWNQDGRSRFMVDDLFLRVWAVNPY